MDLWRLLVSPADTGARNMAIDQAVAECVQAERTPPTLRFYTWRPRALSIGYAQPIASVDRRRAARLGVDIVRRPTGGQAILHHDELTYAVALPRGHPLAADGVLESYGVISRGLTAGLGLLGLAPRSGGWGPASSPVSDGVCFVSPSRHEIAVDGHKLIGSAQTRLHRGILQHGSIVLTHDPEIFSLMGVPEPPSAPSGLRALLPALPPTGALVQAFAAGFAQALELTLRPGRLSAEEQARAHELRDDRYQTDAWLQRH